VEEEHAPQSDTPLDDRRRSLRVVETGEDDAARKRLASAGTEEERPVERQPIRSREDREHGVVARLDHEPLALTVRAIEHGTDLRGHEILPLLAALDGKAFRPGLRRGAIAEKPCEAASLLDEGAERFALFERDAGAIDDDRDVGLR